jgi:hypothetical protein
MKTVFVLTMLILVVATGCATTERIAIKDQPAVCGFLGDSCQDLEKGGEGQPGMRWVNPKARLLSVDDVPVVSEDNIEKIRIGLAGAPPGTPVKMRVLRAGRVIELTSTTP